MQFHRPCAPVFKHLAVTAFPEHADLVSLSTAAVGNIYGAALFYEVVRLFGPLTSEVMQIKPWRRGDGEEPHDASSPAPAPSLGRQTALVSAAAGLAGSSVTLYFCIILQLRWEVLGWAYFCTPGSALGRGETVAVALLVVLVCWGILIDTGVTFYIQVPVWFQIAAIMFPTPHVWSKLLMFLHCQRNYVHIRGIMHDITMWTIR